MTKINDIAHVLKHY